MKALHVFYNVFMGCGFLSLSEYLKKDLKRNECAVFVNKAKTACKILFPDGLLLYYKPAAGILTPSAIADIPYIMGNKTGLQLESGVWGSLLKEFAVTVRKQA